MAGPHSGWPYPEGTQHPNFTDEQRDEQALRATILIARGISITDVAKELGIHRCMVYERLKSINRQLIPTRDLGLSIQYNRTEWLLELLVKRLLRAEPESMSHDTFVRAVAEARQLGASQRALIDALTGDAPPIEPPSPGEAEDWEVAEEGHG